MMDFLKSKAFWKGFMSGFGALGAIFSEPAPRNHRTFSPIEWLGLYDATILVTSRAYQSGDYSVNVYRTLYGTHWFDMDTFEEISMFSELHDELDRVYRTATNQREALRRAA